MRKSARRGKFDPVRKSVSFATRPTLIPCDLDRLLQSLFVRSGEIDPGRIAACVNFQVKAFHAATPANLTMPAGVFVRPR